MRRLLAEPLVHFLGIGLLLFLVYALVAPADTGYRRIVVSRAIVADLTAQHERLTPVGHRQRRIQPLWGRVAGGCHVDRDIAGLLRSAGYDVELTYELVIPELADLEKGHISIASPIGRGLIGKKTGDNATIAIPSGKKRFEILDVKTIHEKPQA